MKVFAALSLCAATLIPQFSLADAPHTQMEAGLMQAVFDFCSKADPENDKRFDQKAKALLGNISDRDRDDLRKNADFKVGYGVMESLLDKVHKADAVRGCAEFLTPKHPHMPTPKPPHKR